MNYLSLNINAMIFISIIASFSILYFKLAFNSIIPIKELKIWVISWYGVTVLAFFTFNFIVFIFVSAIFIFFMAKQAENKLALFCILLFAIPGYSEKISVLLTVNFTRELSLILLLPLLKECKKQEYLQKFGKLTTDKLVMCLLVLMFILRFRGLYMPTEPSTWSEESRHALYIFTDTFLPYYIASRYIKNFKHFTMVLVAFIFIFIIVGCIGMFEIAKSYLLYGNLRDALGVDFSIKEYLFRDGMIRASASVDHSLVLGFVMIIALGFYLFVSNYIKSNLLKISGFILIIGGIISPLARGAWVATVVMLTVYFSIGNKKFRNITVMVIAGLMALPLLTIIPGGQKIVNLMPFIGNVESGNVEYREKLFEPSILVIKNHPFFGVFDATKEPEMQVLIQGQGIIDIVNYYLQVTLSYGLVGLALFVMILISITWPLYKCLKSIKNQKSLEYLCGKSLFALLIGIFVNIATLAALDIITTVLFLLAGLTVSYIRIIQKGTFNNVKTGLENEKISEYPTSRVIKS